MMMHRDDKQPIKITVCSPNVWNIDETETNRILSPYQDDEIEITDENVDGLQ